MGRYPVISVSLKSMKQYSYELAFEMGYYQYMAGHTAGLELNGLPTLPIDYE